MALSSKFSDLQYYAEALSEGYQLLPFNFHKLKSEIYLVVNLVGEHLIISRKLLIELVEGKLESTNQYYNEFKAKHFIMDCDSNVALDLLSLKVRTKQFPVSQFTALHMFVVTLRCDYTCKYCQVSRRMEGDDSYDMTQGSADSALNLVFKSPSKSIKIEFQGGEPLINFPLIRYIVGKATEINNTEKRTLQFVITTNLTFLSDEILNFCSKYDVFISTSLDGPEAIHNKNRPRPNKDGHKRTVDGINRIQSVLGIDKIAALMTTTEESLAFPSEIVDEYVRNNLHSIFLRPLSPYGFAIKTKQIEKYNITKWMKFYIEGLDYIIQLNKAGYYLVEQYTAIILRKILTPGNTGYVDLQSPAGIGISGVVYNYDGDVYASDESRMLKEMGDETFKLGNVNTNSYEEIFLSDNLLDALENSIAESAPMCSDCGLLNYCGSDPVYHHATQGDVVGKKPLSFYCNRNTSVIEHIFSLLEDVENRQVLESWI